MGVLKRVALKFAPVVATLAVGGLELARAYGGEDKAAITTAEDMLASSIVKASTAKAETVGQAVSHVTSIVSGDPAVGVKSDAKVQDDSLGTMDKTQAYAMANGGDYSRIQNAEQLRLNAGQYVHEVEAMRGDVALMQQDLAEGRAVSDQRFSDAEAAFNRLSWEFNAKIMQSDAEVMRMREELSRVMAQRQNYARDTAFGSNSSSMVVQASPALLSGSNNAPQTAASEDHEAIGVGYQPLGYQSQIPTGSIPQPGGMWGTRTSTHYPVANRPRGGKLRVVPY